MPCKIDLRDATSYHFNMKKSKGTQESTGAAAKGTPGKRTATRAAKATEGSTGKEAGAAKETEPNDEKRREELEKRLKTLRNDLLDDICRDGAEIVLQDKVEREKFDKLLINIFRDAEAKRRGSGVDAIRLLLSREEFKGIGALFLFNKYNELEPDCAVLKAAPDSFELFIRRWEQETARLFAEDKRKICSDIAANYRVLQGQADKLYREGKFEELCRFIRKRDDCSAVWIVVQGIDEEDIVWIDWNPESHPNLKKSTLAIPMPVILRARIKEDLKELVKRRLIVSKMETVLVRETIKSTLDLMQSYNVPLGYIFYKAEEQLDKERRREVSYTEYEVETLVKIEDSETRLERFRKMQKIGLESVINDKLRWKERHGY